MRRWQGKFPFEFATREIQGPRMGFEQSSRGRACNCMWCNRSRGRSLAKQRLMRPERRRPQEEESRFEPALCIWIEAVRAVERRNAGARHRLKKRMRLTSRNKSYYEDHIG